MFSSSVSLSIYISIISKERPENFQERLGFNATVLTEALQLGCKGWLSYNKMFREHIEKQPTHNWSMLHTTFYSVS